MGVDFEHVIEVDEGAAPTAPVQRRSKDATLGSDWTKRGYCHALGPVKRLSAVKWASLRTAAGGVRPAHGCAGFGQSRALAV